MLNTFIYAYNPASEGSKELRDALKIKSIKHENSRFKGSANKRVINWGSSKLPDEILKCTVINQPKLVALCSNKLTFFKHVAARDVSLIPEWTEDMDQAIRWCGEGHTVCARTVLNGHSAEGLVIMEKSNPNGFVKASLYTKYVPKKEEYRVHIVHGEVIDIQRKTLSEAKKTSGDEINWKVRNHDNGFIYQRDGINPPASVTNVSLECMAAVGLDFGAVDVVYNAKSDRSYVLEINTAPGLQGTSVTNYAKALASK